MLFVLRLLPSYKKWQQKVVYVAFGINFAITMLAKINYGISCTPLQAAWETIPGSHCFSKDLIVIVTKVNGSMCAFD